MKILHITASYKPAFIYGGPVMSVAKLCEEVSWKTEVGGPKLEDGRLEAKVEITVYTTLANGAAELAYPNGTIKIVDGIKVQYFKRITKDHSHFSPALLWHLWQTVKKYDLVHIHAWWNLVTMPACLIAYLKGVKVVLSPRGTLSAYSFETDKSVLKRLFHQIIGKRLLNNCFIHVTSGKEEKDTLHLLSPRQVVNIPNFVAFPKEIKEERIKNKELRVKNKEQRAKNKENVNSEKYLEDKVLRMIFLSRIEEKKGLELLFESLAEVAFPWMLSIVGDGEEDYVERLKSKVRGPRAEDRTVRTEDESWQSAVRSRETEDREWRVESDGLEVVSKTLGNRMEWLGPIYGDQKFEMLTQHDLFVLPSFDENFANVVIESLYCGTPVLLTKNVGLSDYVAQNNLGWICERNPKQLTLTLNQAYEDLKNKSFDVASISDKVREDFEDSKITAQYISFYESVLKAKT